MLKIAIVGGKLQGVEAAYLACKAGFETLLIDRKNNVPAIGLVDRFLRTDVLAKEKMLIDELKKVDLILPAMENDEVLDVLEELAEKHGFSLAFDFNAYTVSSSKKMSDELIHRNNIPSPRYYPYCQGPCIMKPSTGSGSDGVKYISNREELEKIVKDPETVNEYIIQEYLAGKSYSIEVIGQPGDYKTFEVTELFMDEVYDCKRVTAPVNISDEMRDRFSHMAIKLANVLGLKGIMDVEVIEDKGELKVLEIDARIPSQTPTVVYHSTGINLLEEICRLFCPDKIKAVNTKRKKHVAYEHFIINNESIRVQGEHVMGDVERIKLLTGFCGADEVLTDYAPGKGEFRGTFINTSETAEGLKKKRNKMIEEINKLKRRKLKFVDLSPLY